MNYTNSVSVFSWQAQSLYPDVRGERQCRVVNPAKKVLLMDKTTAVALARYDGPQPGFAVASVGCLVSTNQQRHGHSYPIVYVDGHAACMKWEQALFIQTNKDLFNQYMLPEPIVQ